jgi:type IV secretory pathway VirB3-like protein
MFAHVVAGELRRLISRRRYWLLGAVLSGILVYQISVVSPGYANPPSASGAFIYSFRENLAGFGFLVTSLAVGDSFAIDRSTSWATFTLTRGLTRRKYIAAKALGMAITVCLLVIMSLTIAGVAAMSTRGLSPTVHREELGMVTAADHAVYLAHPWWFAVKFAGVHLLAAAAYSTTAVLLAVWVPIPFVVSIVPPLIFLAAITSVPETANSPLALLRLTAGGTIRGGFVFFLAWLVLVATAAIIAYGKLEDA